ncbi:hypothetical protein N7492_010303 [Penicillium capsulatum]|uniref:Uncharacterized protein n=1 Tax=Penicillium capsulatum TaxID=69766 RepID=A0A9W9HNI8_9EURO|nr:hypothetical protein N7492_010303 [Penicillium capsulatum]KAJ6112809.1 hypothetical protein N7512_008133 [Penicillium capsulatum]
MQSPRTISGTATLRQDEWSTLLKDEVEHQAVGLIEHKHLTFTDLHFTLNNKEDFEDWYSVVLRTLDSGGLANLVDSDIPRPAKSDPDAKNWQEVSKHVAQWLEGNMSRDMYRLVRSQGMRVVLADEFMEAALKAFRGMGPYGDIARIGDFFRTRREDFPSTEKFIDKIRQQYFTITSGGIYLFDSRSRGPIAYFHTKDFFHLSPYIALTSLLDQINQSESKFLVPMAVEHLFPLKDEARSAKFNLNDFQRSCNYLLGLLNICEEEDPAAISFAAGM